MPEISAIIITKNEATNISRCITSVLPVADEVLVFDSQSEDETVAIAENLGVKVIQCEWKGYTATKNEANQQASHNFILAMDADEALSTELQQNILKEKNQLTGAYYYNRLNNYCGKWIKHGGFYPDQKTRLFDRRIARWTGGFVHESVQVDDGLPHRHLKGDLLHYTYTSRKDHEARAEKYAGLAAMGLQHKPYWSLRVKMLLSPLVRFMKHYIFQLGFLDGAMGRQLISLTAEEVRLKYAKALELKRSA